MTRSDEPLSLVDVEVTKRDLTDLALSWAPLLEAPPGLTGERHILKRFRRRVVPREVSEGLLLVALSRPNLGAPAVKASPPRAPLPEAPQGPLGESHILKRFRRPAVHREVSEGLLLAALSRPRLCRRRTRLKLRLSFWAHLSQAN